MRMDETSVRAILVAARKAVDEAGLPESLQAVAFERAIELLAGKVTPSPAGGKTELEDELSDDQRVAKIAKRMDVDASLLARVYDLHEEDVSLIVKRAKLAASQAGATRQIAVLYCAARQAGGYDQETTNVALVRDRVADMGVLNEANFATHLKDADGISIRGSGPSRELKVTQPGYERAGELVTQLAGSGS